MALLNAQWFMTHRADEAICNLVKVLDRIDGENATKVILDAVVSAEEIIPKEIPVEIQPLSPIFLSYQWNS